MVDWINTNMEVIILLIPIAFLHGWFTGRSHGIKKGSAAMFDHMYDQGIVVPGKKNTKRIEISLDE